jgi:anti-sigma B factor antagonist
MKHKLENDTLTIYLEGQLNSYNADAVEKEINGIVEAAKFSHLALDFNDLKYISSAGLRIIMSLKQRYNDIVLKRVPNDINDIFVMVGFQTIITIERK